MSEIALASINTFGISPKADFVPPSEELVFVLTGSQLQAIVTQAVEKAIQPLQDRIEFLEATADKQEENQLIELQLINQLRKATKKEPQPMQKDRGEILRALLAANDGKMLAKDARQKMRLDKATFSRLLDTLKDYIDIKSFHTDKRKLVLMLKIS